MGTAAVRFSGWGIYTLNDTFKVLQYALEGSWNSSLEVYSLKKLALRDFDLWKRAHSIHVQ